MADVASLQLAEGIEAIHQEAIGKPDTPDGGRILDKRWLELESQLWKAGPLSGRITGLVWRLKRRDAPFRLQGIANAIDNDIRLSDAETTALTDGERRAVREAVLNVALRLFRLVNPSELYVATYQSTLLKNAVEKGLEFDVAVIPDISEFDDNDPIDLNGLYVAVSRPRHAVLLGCKSSRAAHKVMKQLCERGDLIPYRCASSK